MSAPPERADDRRVLILAPVGGDGRLASNVLGGAGIECLQCSNVDQLCDEIANGVGAVLITQEVLWDRDIRSLLTTLESQPSWSAIPVVIAADLDHAARRPGELLRQFEKFKVTFLVRPVSIMSLVTTLRSALAARARQYQVRDLMAELRRELRLRDEFLATLSHELRNPLGAVRNAVQLLQMTQRDDTLLMNSIAIIDRQSRDLSRLLDDLLDVARVTQGKISLRKETFSVNGLLEEITRDMEQAGTLCCRVSLSLPDDDLPVHCDRLRIKQVFVNLIDNADKFSHEGETIDIDARLHAGEVVVTVRDRGIGIAPDRLESIFNLFSQASAPTRPVQGGLGIGLTIVKSLVQMNGGTVSAYSEGLNKGTEFTVRLPLADPGITDATDGDSTFDERAGAKRQRPIAQSKDAFLFAGSADRVR